MALFTALPIHVQPVCWISGRPEVLCAFFVLLTVYLHLRGTWLARIGALVCALLAAASKETAVILPVLLFAVDRAAGRKQVRIIQYIAYISVAAGFFALRFGMLGFLTTQHSDFGLQSLMHRIVLGTQYNAWGLFATIVPYKLVLFYSEINLGFWQGFSSTLLWGLVGILLWRLRNRWILAALVVALVPTTGIVSTTPLADRYMLIPSIFVVIGLAKLFNARKLVIPAAALIAVYFAISSYYIGDWQGRVEYARRWTQRYTTGYAHIDYSAALADIEGCLVDGADALSLYHWYYADELFKLEGRRFPPEALPLREQILNKMEFELGIPPAKQKYCPARQDR
jgi:hypothetical protein